MLQLNKRYNNILDWIIVNIYNHFDTMYFKAIFYLLDVYISKKIYKKQGLIIYLTFDICKNYCI
jgi:hypothetical protein